MIRRPPRSTRTDTSPTLRSSDLAEPLAQPVARRDVLHPRHVAELLLRQAARPQPVDQDAGAVLRFGGQVDPFGVQLHGRHLGTSAKRSEEHTSELQSLMRISFAVFCLKKKIQHKIYILTTITTD